MVKLENYVAHEVLNLPTKYEEVTPEFIEECCKEVHAADNHVIVGLIYKEKLTYILSTAKNPNNVKPSLIYPVFAGQGSDKCLNTLFGDNVKTKDKIIISGSDLSRGYHINVKTNRISIDKVVKFVNEDKILLKECTVGGKIAKQLNDTFCYFLEFKIVPLCDIKGVYKNIETTCPYIEKLEGERQSSLVL